MLPPDRLVKGGVLLLPCVGDGRQSGTVGQPVDPQRLARGGGRRRPGAARDRRQGSGSTSPSAPPTSLITEEELAKRRAAWKPHIKDSQTPWQELQRKYVGQLASGACLDFAVNYQKIAQTKGVPRHSH
jgi:dihydroxy-acid dehydratase